ncbi:MAG: pyridoxamine 5'-phosphate oxidase family protein, partial [Quadrisphaera sp.]
APVRQGQERDDRPWRGGTARGEVGTCSTPHHLHLHLQQPPPPPGRSLVVLDEAECWVLLRSQRLGRLVYTEAALPAVIPVGYAVVGTDLVMALASGGQVAAAARGVRGRLRGGPGRPGGEDGVVGDRRRSRAAGGRPPPGRAAEG